ncbi:MAG: hypothetical protein A2Y25_09925 [Candidatus Melainabacteria bacterium GWF2_37_15]|nr:MAG: hypothetical protein A2Y25_09925 [Candidatus Melainabacteria bacterium GWF2_37_15]
MKLSIKELLEVTQGKLIKGENLDEKFSISTDTRSITTENIFLPLKGANFDGHDYIDEAINQGCKAYFIDKEHKPSSKAVEFVISVDDTLSAYLKAANYVRKKINPVVVAITGSSGKTSTKEFISSVLSTSFITHKSALNHNNEVGLCQTLFSMPESCEYAVIEMGMRGLGEIELLSKYSEPDIAVITNIGTSHIGRLGSVENIAKAKYEITSYLKDKGTLLAFDDELTKKYCNWQAKKIFYGKEYEIISEKEDSTEFVYENEQYIIPVVGKYNVVNSIAAIEIGKLAGISYENLKKGLLNYIPVGERGTVIDTNNNIKFVVDCYNANPDSVMASIDSVISVYKNSKVVLVLGDMAELGEFEEQMHRKVGQFIAEKSVHSLITVGQKAELIAETAGEAINKRSFSNNAEAAEFLQNYLEKDTVVLLKGSRCMKMEEIANYLK